MTKWIALVEADCAVSGIEAEDEVDARELLKEEIDTGQLGPVRIKAIEKDE